MIPEHDALLFFDLLKEGPAASGARGERRLDPRLKAGWLQFQALRALALEAAPEPGEKLLREALERCRRASVERQLVRLTGEGAAREILSGPDAQRHTLPAWLLAALALGVSAAAWLAFRAGGPTGWGSVRPAPGAATAPPQALPFEFPLATPPVAEALAGPEEGATDADDVHAESKVERQASRLLREHLHEATRRDEAAPRPKRRPALRARTPPPPRTAASAPGLTLASDELWSAASAVSAPAGVSTETRVILDMPGRRDIDVRLFSGDGRSLRVLASGAHGPGAVGFTLTAQDDQGRALKPGAYYLRVMTPWFSRVEPIQIH